MLPEDGDAEMVRDVEAAAWVQFTGPTSGCLAIWLHGSLRTTLIANMLGTDETPPAEDLDDGLKEIVNVICGNVLTEALGTDAVFDMTPPELIAPASVPDEIARDPLARVKVPYPDGWIEVAFYAHSARMGRL
jgi:CheY-specific phosphatase CheX